MKKRTVRIAMAAVGATAVLTMGGMSVAAGATRRQATAVPEHFGGPVDTSIYSPTATLGMPTLSYAPTVTPAPMNAPG